MEYYFALFFLLCLAFSILLAEPNKGSSKKWLLIAFSTQLTAVVLSMILPRFLAAHEGGLYAAEICLTFGMLASCVLVVVAGLKKVP